MSTAVANEPSNPLLSKVEADWDLPVDKSLNSLLMFQFNFNDLKKVLDFIISHQKKQQFTLE